MRNTGAPWCHMGCSGDWTPPVRKTKIFSCLVVSNTRTVSGFVSICLWEDAHTEVAPIVNALHVQEKPPPRPTYHTQCDLCLRGFRRHTCTQTAAGFDIRPQCSDEVGKLSDFMRFPDNQVTWERKAKGSFFVCFFFFYGWIRSSRQRGRWGEEKDSWSVRVYGAVEESNIIHACHAIRLGTVQVQRGRCCVREKNCELTSWREQV